MSEEEVRLLIHQEFTARGIVGGPIDEFVKQKMLVLINDATQPAKLMPMAAEFFPSGTANDQGALARLLSDKFRRALLPMFND